MKYYYCNIDELLQYTERSHIIVCMTPLYGVFRIQSVFVRDNLYCLELEVEAMMYKQA